MKSINYLNSYQRLYWRSETIAGQIEELEARATGTNSFRYNHDKITSSNKSDIFDIIDRKVQLEQILAKMQEELEDIESGIREAVSDMTQRDRQIAEMTWIDFEGSVYISQTLRITRRTVFRRRSAIIDHVQKWIDKESK